MSFVKDFIKESFTPPTPKSSLNCNSKELNRIEFLDLAKGICIILVVLHHICLWSDNDMYQIPNSVALLMPLFFVLSGFFFKNLCGFWTFLIKKINNIVVPFLFWLIISDLWSVWGSLRANQYQSAVDFTIVRFIKDPLSDPLYSNGALWFLMCLFITNLLFYIIYLKDSKKICFFVLCFAIVGYLLYRADIRLPLWSRTALVALPFFFLGHWCKGMSYLILRLSTKKSLILGIGFIIVSYIIYYVFDNPCIYMRDCSFQGLLVMAYLNSFSYVMGILFLCKTINWLPIVSYFGRYSIVVLCVHGPLLRLPQIIKRHMSYEVTFWEFTVIILLICWFSIPICKRFLPYFVAQKPLFKIPSEKTCQSTASTAH